MNAYELADELENYVWMNPNNNRDYCKEVKDMLRKQADRIAELEKESANLEQSLKNALVFINNQKQTKPLSDEEIMDIAEQSDYSPLEIEMGYDYEIRIARAIEERHGIK